MISDSIIRQKSPSSGYDIFSIEKDHNDGQKTWYEGVLKFISLRSFILPLSYVILRLFHIVIKDDEGQDLPRNRWSLMNAAQRMWCHYSKLLEIIAAGENGVLYLFYGYIMCGAEFRQAFFPMNPGNGQCQRASAYSSPRHIQ